MWWSGFIGIGLILGVSFLLSKHKSRIDWALVLRALALQVILGVLLLQVPLIQGLVQQLGNFIDQVLSFADQGAAFVVGPLGKTSVLEAAFGPGQAFIFGIKLLASIIFVSTLVSMAYHVGLLQLVVRLLSWVVTRLIGASGAEALSNTASVFVGQVEAQLLVKPYLGKATNSELLTMMSGSMACIAGGVLAIYISMGIPASYLLTASLMAIPGALVIAKLVLPETSEPLTKGSVQLNVEKRSVNLIDAASRGAMEGWQIGISVIVMLVAFVSLIAMLDAGLGWLGQVLVSMGAPSVVAGIELTSLSMTKLLGTLFSFAAVALGVPAGEAPAVGSLMGSKLILNEFVAYTQLLPMMTNGSLSPKAVAIATFALCGFANIASVAIQLGGIGAMVPERKSDLARLGGWALLCGTFASYLSAALAGILISLQPVMSTKATWLPWAIIAVAVVLIVLVSLVQAVLGAGRQLSQQAIGAQPFNGDDPMDEALPYAEPMPTNVTSMVPKFEQPAVDAVSKPDGLGWQPISNVELLRR